MVRYCNSKWVLSRALTTFLGASLVKIDSAVSCSHQAGLAAAGLTLLDMAADINNLHVERYGRGTPLTEPALIGQVRDALFDCSPMPLDRLDCQIIGSTVLDCLATGHSVSPSAQFRFQMLVAMWREQQSFSHDVSVMCRLKDRVPSGALGRGQ